MSKHIKTQLLTPDGTLFEGEATAIQVPGISGNFQILYNHAPLVSALGMGEIIIQSVQEGNLHYAVLGGFIEVNENLCTILAEKAERSDLIPSVEVQAERDRLKSLLKTITQNREEVEYELRIAENRLKVAES